MQGNKDDLADTVVNFNGFSLTLKKPIKVSGFALCIHFIPLYPEFFYYYYTYMYSTYNDPAAGDAGFEHPRLDLCATNTSPSVFKPKTILFSIAI